MEDWLYANQATLTPGGVRQAAKDIGGIDRLRRPVRQASSSQVKSDIGLAIVLNIRVTPTFYINGIRLEGGLPAEYFEMALQYELKKAGKMVP